MRNSAKHTHTQREKYKMSAHTVFFLEHRKREGEMFYVLFASTSWRVLESVSYLCSLFVVTPIFLRRFCCSRVGMSEGGDRRDSFF